MKNVFTAIFIAVSMLAYGCGNDYDDSALWKELDGMFNRLDELHEQVDALTSDITKLEEIVGSDAITSITKNGEGNWVVAYKDSNNVERTVVIATVDDIVDSPILGVKAEDGVNYWTLTSAGKTDFLLDTDGAKIPVGGRLPVIGHDEQGYWTVGGNRILDSNGDPVRAREGSVSLFRDIGIDGDGNAVFTLGDGSAVTVPVFSAFNISFDVNVRTVVGDSPPPLVVNYELSGAKASAALVSIEKQVGLTAVLDEAAKTITVTFPVDFAEGSVMVMIYDGGDNVLIKPLLFMTMHDEMRGIWTADDLVAFAAAVNAGESIGYWRNRNGEVVMHADIDMSGVPAWTPMGKATPSTATANQNVVYTTAGAFDGIFDGKGFSLLNVDWTFDVSDGNLVYGLFGSLEGTVRNLTVGSATDNSRITVTGNAPQGACIGSVAGYAGSGSVIENCRNYAGIAFAGSDASNISVRIGGIAGIVDGGTIGGDEASKGCVNYGDITCGTIVNAGNGQNGSMSVGGITGMVYGDAASLVSHCINEGGVSAPSGRGGGITATGISGSLENCTNRGLVQDDTGGVFAGNSTPYNLKRMGGLAGGTGASFSIIGCVNEGDVFSQLGCRTGGFVGHNGGTITNCENTGTVLSDFLQVGSNNHGAGWACGYNNGPITGCTIGGKVGDYTVYKDDPSAAPASRYSNAVCHGTFVPEDNGLSDMDEEYYDWTLVEEKTLHSGVKYSHYSLKYIAQHIYVVEADITDPSVEVSTAMANDQVPNPNANGNSNNGFKLRETLSQVSDRKRTEGQNIVAGINTGFFDSNDGFPRGAHIQDGELYYMNNPIVSGSLANHRPGFTFFTDRTVSFENREFKGYLQVDGVDYEFYSVNDTIVRLTVPTVYDANLYTNRCRQTPFPGISNPVGKDALFIVARNDAPMLVNGGWADASVTAVVDGRNGAAITVPYVTGENEWVLQVRGDKAAGLAAKVSAGTRVKIRTDMKIGGQTKPVLTHNASMYWFLKNGMWNKPGSSEDNVLYPMTVAGANQDRTKVYFIACDGRQPNVSVGLNYLQMHFVAKKLGCYDAVRFDGGGSTTMWIYDGGSGRVVNVPSDSKGERSCMNYFHIRIK